MSGPFIQKNQSFRNVSLIIPACSSDATLLTQLLESIPQGLFGRIIIVLSGCLSEPDLPSNLRLLLNKRSCDSTILFVNNFLNPGEARNLGARGVDTKYICFLDVRTLPLYDWYQSLLDFIQLDTNEIQYGSVHYVPSSFLSEVFIAATYGFQPLRCVPGSILSLDTFAIIGNFISARSGEDSEWIMRSKLIGIPARLHSSSPFLEYRLNVNRKILPLLFRKWFRNYVVSFDLPGYQVHKYLYTAMGLCFFLLFLSTWNWRIAGWNESSILYLPYVTRVALSIVVILYIVFRAIYLPISKGVLQRRNSILIILFSFPLAHFLDLIKMYACFRCIFRSLLGSGK